MRALVISDTHFGAWTGRDLLCAWPGTAIVIDDSEPRPRLVELPADLDPPASGPGLSKAPA